MIWHSSSLSKRVNLRGKLAYWSKASAVTPDLFAPRPSGLSNPGQGAALSPASTRFYMGQDVVVVQADLNKTWKDYNYANKVHAAAFVESLVGRDVANLVFLDTDFLLLRPPEELLLRDNEMVAARPVDKAGVGIPSPEPPNEYWQMLFTICGVDPTRLWDVTTTVDDRRIRASFQGGLLCVRPSRGIFQRWRANLEHLAKAEDIHRYAPASLEACFFEQSLFAATVLANVAGSQVKVLDWRYNYPLPWHDALPPSRRATFLDDVVALHYHRDFDDLAWTKRINVRESIKNWLMRQLPLKEPVCSSPGKNTTG